MNELMNREKFNNVPQIDIQRSKFTRNYNHKTTMNVGDIVPIYIEQLVLPGDTFKISANAIARLTTPLFPTMDNCFGDIYFFAVPYRLIFDKWEELNGENKEGAWAVDVEYEIPHFIAPEGGVKEGGFHDQAAIPTKTKNIKFSQLPRRAYELIYNEWFRDQNVIEPIQIDKGTGDKELTEADDVLFKAAKLHDYFTSALPGAQKGDPISLPLGTTAPVFTGLEEHNANRMNQESLIMRGLANELPTGLGASVLAVQNGNQTDSGSTILVNNNGMVGTLAKIAPTNLYTDLSEATAASINAIRLAFQTQRILEKDARGGTRYTEIIKQHFNVDSPDSRLQRPEYLGSKRFTIDMNQVAQTSETNEQSPQGHISAYSLSGFETDEITKSFTEHSLIMGLIVIRTQQTYQQGLPKAWTKRSRFDFYLPALAHIGEQPILKKELMATGTETDNEVFGYQEAWAEYRMKPSEVSGKFRSNAEGTLDAWHYAPNFDNPPVISKSFLEQTPTEMDRTLTVSHTLTDQFIIDFMTQEELYRPLPLYSVPGLIDHF